jgi:hypothetical protein
MKLPSRDASKLFHVLVVGGMSMGIPVAGCSGDTTTGGQDAEASDGGGGGNDSSSPKDSGTIQDVQATDACLNKPGDCTHGLCSW